MITIDGNNYDVPVVSVRMKAEFLDKYAERTEDGVLHRELIGTYFNYEIKFGRDATIAEIASLWEKLTEPEEFHTVVVPDEDGDFTFTAYFANVSMDLSKDKGGANKFWKDLTANFIAKSPARTP
jgi:hypothetical protein